MNEYTPDVWVVVHLSGTKVSKAYYKILAGWHGGYLDGDSWKLSSGIEKVIDRETYWEIPQSSGSVYICYKEAERFNSTTASIYSFYSDQSNKEMYIKHVPITEFKGE
jgi:hypothetical protein